MRRPNTVMRCDRHHVYLPRPESHERAAVHFAGHQPQPVCCRRDDGRKCSAGITAGGMSIGTTFGRIVNRSARAAHKEAQHETV